MMEFSKMTKWKNYDIRFEFKNIDKSVDDIQLLVFLNDELAYSSKKNCFKKQDRKVYELKLGRFKIPHYVPIEKSILLWKDTKEQNRYINFCKKFKYSTCYKLQENLMLKLSDYRECC